ncbi:MAG: aminotransferase class V-fold PLP-dependent enzyme [Pirellulales bacterium]
MQSKRIYFDHAATSWPKSEAATAAAEDYIRRCGATSGRGAYASARVADEILRNARRRIATLIGAENEDAVALCSSGTHALNAAIQGWIRPGDRIITTVIEHNSVLRPLEHLRETIGIEIIHIACDARGVVEVESAHRAARQPAAAVIINHASNVTGAVQDLTAWRAVADACGALLIVDGSQSLGHVPVSMQEGRIDALAAAGHKGLGGLSGSGILVAGRQLQEQLTPLMFGGTGVASEEINHTPHWPHSVEVGNLNLPAVASLAESTAALLESTPLNNPQAELADQLLSGLSSLIDDGAVTIHGGADRAAAQLPIVSMTFRDWDIHEVAAVLDSQFGIEVRAGLHCAGMIHDYIGSRTRGGTLRVSFGHGSMQSDVEELVAALKAILSV